MGHTMAGMRVSRVIHGYEARQLDGRVTRIPAIYEQFAKGVMIGGRVPLASSDGVTTTKRGINAQKTGMRVCGAPEAKDLQVVGAAQDFNGYPTYPRVPVGDIYVSNYMSLRGVA